MNNLKEKVNPNEFRFKESLFKKNNYADILSDMVAHVHTGHYTRHTIKYDKERTLSKVEIFEGNGRSKGKSLICINYLDSEGFRYEDFINLTCYIMQLGIQAIIDGSELKLC